MKNCVFHLPRFTMVFGEVAVGLGSLAKSPKRLNWTENLPETKWRAVQRPIVKKRVRAVTSPCRRLPELLLQ